MDSFYFKGLEKINTIPEQFHVALMDCISKGELVEKLTPLKIHAMNYALENVKPKYCKFYHGGQHLTDLDFKVGMIITDHTDLIYADKASRASIKIAYLKKIYSLLGSDLKSFCPYNLAEDFYLKSVEKISEDISALSGIDLSKWKMVDKIKFIKFITLCSLPNFFSKKVI